MRGCCDYITAAHVNTPHMWTTNLTYAGKGLGMPNSTQRRAGRMSRCAQTVKICGMSFPRSSLETTERSGTCMGRGAAPAFVGSYSIEDNPAREAVSPTWSHRYWATSYRNPLHESTIRTNCSQHNQTYRMTDLRVSLMQNCDPMQVWELGTLSLCVGHGISWHLRFWALQAAITWETGKVVGGQYLRNLINKREQAQSISWITSGSWNTSFMRLSNPNPPRPQSNG